MIHARHRIDYYVGESQPHHRHSLLTRYLLLDLRRLHKFFLRRQTRIIDQAVSPDPNGYLWQIKCIGHNDRLVDLLVKQRIEYRLERLSFSFKDFDFRDKLIDQDLNPKYVHHGAFTIAETHCSKRLIRVEYLKVITV